MRFGGSNITTLNENYVKGWKAIANYLGVSERTAMRWAEQHALPVCRDAHGQGSVLARRSELDAWLVTRDDVPCSTQELSDESQSARTIALASTAERHQAIIAMFSPPLETERASFRFSQRVIILAILTALAVSAFVMLREGVAATSWQFADNIGVNGQEPESAQLYIDAKALISRRTAQSLSEAQQILGRVVTIDADFQPAYVAIGEANLLSAEFGRVDRATAFRRADRAATTALRLAPQDPEANRLAAFLTYWRTREIKPASVLFKRSLAGKPDSYQTHLWYGNALVDSAHFAKARQHLDRALVLAPDVPSVRVDRLIGIWQMGETDAALRGLTEAESDYPNLSSIPGNLALFALVEDRPEDYLAASKRWANLVNDPWQKQRVAAEEAAFARSGRVGLYRTIADVDLATLPPLSYWHGGPLVRAIAAANLGDKERTVAILKQMATGGRTTPPLRFPMAAFAKWRNDATIRELTDAIIFKPRNQLPSRG